MTRPLRRPLTRPLVLPLRSGVNTLRLTRLWSEEATLATRTTNLQPWGGPIPCVFDYGLRPLRSLLTGYPERDFDRVPLRPRRGHER